MSTEADLDVINAYMRDAATRAVADAIRAHAGQLELASDLPGSAISALSGPAPAQQRSAYTTVTPVPIERYDQPDGWWRRHWPHALIGTAAATFIGLTVWAIASIVSAAEHAAAAHSDGLSSLGALLLVGLLALMFCGRRKGGGRTFSGTFSGRMD